MDLEKQNSCLNGSYLTFGIYFCVLILCKQIMKLNLKKLTIGLLFKRYKIEKNVLLLGGWAYLVYLISKVRAE